MGILVTYRGYRFQIMCGVKRTITIQPPPQPLWQQQCREQGHRHPTAAAADGADAGLRFVWHPPPRLFKQGQLKEADRARNRCGKQFKLWLGWYAEKQYVPRLQKWSNSTITCCISQKFERHLVSSLLNILILTLTGASQPLEQIAKKTQLCNALSVVCWTLALPVVYTRGISGQRSVKQECPLFLLAKQKPILAVATSPEAFTIS